MAITADGSTLVVAGVLRQSAHRICHRCRRRARRATRVRRKPEDDPDGRCIDADGAGWHADVGNRRCVRVRERGRIMATVELDRGAFSCTVSRDDRPVLCVVGRDGAGHRRTQPPHRSSPSRPPLQEQGGRGPSSDSRYRCGHGDTWRAFMDPMHTSGSIIIS
jgi:sugar lactone lactonase YvrE